MKSLRLYDADKDVETRLMNLLHDSRILYDKGLVKMSFDQLDKIKTISINREKFTYYILAARQELQYLASSQFSGINEYELLEKQKKITELLYSFVGWNSLRSPVDGSLYGNELLPCAHEGDAIAR